MAVGAAWGIMAIPPVAARRPNVTIRRPPGKVFSLDVLPAEHGGRRRLKVATMALVDEIHDSVKVQPSASTHEIAHFMAIKRSDD